MAYKTGNLVQAAVNSGVVLLFTLAGGVAACAFLPTTASVTAVGAAVGIGRFVGSLVGTCIKKKILPWIFG